MEAGAAAAAIHLCCVYCLQKTPADVGIFRTMLICSYLVFSLDDFLLNVG